MEDLTGKVFGRLIVIGIDKERNKKEAIKYKYPKKYFLCKCSCGNTEIRTVNAYNLKTGRTLSCGCLKHEKICERNKKYCTKTNKIERIDFDTIRMFDEKGYSCIIDSEDYDFIKNWYWRKSFSKVKKSGYWITNSKDFEKDGKTSLRLHQEIAKIKFGEYDTIKLFPDHLDRDVDNNKKINLELKTNSENMKNRSLSKANKTGKTGVSYDTNKNKYLSSITVNYKTIHLGAFDNIQDAIEARKLAEIEYGFTCDEITASVE